FKTWAYGISPNGQMISFLKEWKGHWNIFIQEGPHGRSRRVTSETKDDVGYKYVWKDDRCLIYRVGPSYFWLDPTGKRRAKKIKPFDDLLDCLQGKSPNDEILVGIERGKKGITDVWRLNIKSRKKKMRKVAKHPDWKKFGIVQRWFVNSSGDVCAAIS